MQAADHHGLKSEVELNTPSQKVETWQPCPEVRESTLRISISPGDLDQLFLENLELEKIAESVIIEIAPAIGKFYPQKKLS